MLVATCDGTLAGVPADVASLQKVGREQAGPNVADFLVHPKQHPCDCDNYHGPDDLLTLSWLYRIASTADTVDLQNAFTLLSP